MLPTSSQWSCGFFVWLLQLLEKLALVMFVDLQSEEYIYQQTRNVRFITCIWWSRFTVGLRYWCSVAWLCKMYSCKQFCMCEFIHLVFWIHACGWYNYYSFLMTIHLSILLELHLTLIHCSWDTGSCHCWHHNMIWIKAHAPLPAGYFTCMLYLVLGLLKNYVDSFTRSCPHT